MFWWVFDLFFCTKGATASGDQKWTWPLLKLLYNRESSLVLSVPRGVGWRGGVRLKREKMWKWKLLNLVQLFVTPWTIQSMEFSRPEYWSRGSLSLLQGILPTQGPNPGLPHCRQIPYQLGHKGSLGEYIYIYTHTNTHTHTHIHICIIMTDSCCMAETNTLSIKNLIKIIIIKENCPTCFF